MNLAKLGSGWRRPAFYLADGVRKKKSDNKTHIHLHIDEWRRIELNLMCAVYVHGTIGPLSFYNHFESSSGSFKLFKLSNQLWLNSISVKSELLKYLSY